MSDYPPQQEPTFWVTGWLPNGCRVSYTIPFGISRGYEDALAFTDALLAKGFTTSEPGLSAGEKKDKVGYVLRRSVVNERGETPVIDVYVDHEAMTWRTVKVYLNTPEQIADFEAVSGLNLDSLPYYEGKDSVERGDPKLGKYVIPVNHVFYAVAKANPKHEEEQDAEKRKLIPKRLFVRWESASGQSVDKSTGELTDKPAQPKADTDTTWMTNQEAVKQLVSALATWSGLSATELLGNVNIVTSQSTSRWSELKNITRSDVWAAVVLTRVNQDKDKALAMVSDDENKRKSIIYWADKNTDIAF